MKAIPHISAPKTLDTQFEFWFSESRISNINEIEAKADFLGIAKFWIKGQLKADTPYWFYVRSINEFGKSHFVEAEGKPNDNAKDILEVVGEQFLSNKAGQRLQEQMDFNSEAIMENAALTGAVVQRQLKENGNIKAEILEVKTTQVTDRQAFAEDMKKVQAEVGENAAAVQTKATAVFDIDGNGHAINYVGAGVKYNNQFYKAGMVIGAEVKNGQVTTSIGFNANNFGWFNQDSGKMEPFMMAKNGQLFTREEFIEDGSITNAKIGNYIQSRNYITGRAGWKIDKGGGAEFNHVTVRGEIHATSGTFSGTINGADGRFSGAVYATKIVGDVVSVTLGNVSLGNRESIFFHKRLTESMPFDRVFIYGPIMTQRYVGSLGGSGEASVSIYVNNAHVAGQYFSMESFDRGPQCISGTLFTPPITIPANTTPTIKVVLTTHGAGTTYSTPGIGMLFKVSSQWSDM
ncbi:Putative phage host specificity protein (phage tail protein) (fragment) [Xenorhabdus bovienii str. puntauvense]|uniref:Putative phage host specificity protein ( phage tail protein) n=1 Tax=Xenorhabdus bovienii str. puntauvense TaxID=1398201 RepID=A0A077NJJ6_XENBV